MKIAWAPARMRYLTALVSVLVLICCAIMIHLQLNHTVRV
jgi:hypothetical protein